MTVRLAGLGVPGGDPAPWEALGFTVSEGAVRVANGAVMLDRAGLHVDTDGVDLPADLDGIPVIVGEAGPGVGHPNGAFELDHLVVLTSSLTRTSAAIEEVLGLECRRVRETDTVRQAFHRFADVDGARGCILELAETDRVERAVLMGVVFNVRDLDALAARLGTDLVSPPKPAVQPGRSIATVRRSAGLPTAVALMSP